MPTQREKTITKAEGNAGFPVVNMPGDSGFGPDVFVVIASASGLPPNNPAITIQIIPSGEFSAGTDSNGAIGVIKTFVNNGNDKTFSYSGGSTTWPISLWQGNIRAILTSIENVPIDLVLQFSSADINAFGPSPSSPPTNVSSQDTSYDPDDDEGNTTITWTYTNADAFNPTSFAILRDGVPIGNVPWTNGVTSYEFNDVTFSPGSANFVYTIRAYKYAGMLMSGASSSTSVNFGGVLPDISITGSGGIDVGGSATIVLIGDPSGIYTLVAGKTHDTLYERAGAVTSRNVAIPDPHAVTAFVP